MKHDTNGTSRTAQWVAVARSLGTLLPRELKLIDDPYGVGFCTGPVRGVADRLLERPRVGEKLMRRAGPLTSFLLWMQLRTRALDDVLLDFIEGGGKQIVLLGAGYDCRAMRYGSALRRAVVFEVDRAPTQARKIALLAAETLENRVVYASWDFERDDMARLPGRLHELGLDPREPVLTVWEGVTMYLEEPAVLATLAAVRAFGAAGSRLALTYIDRRAVARFGGDQALFRRIVALAGEPWRFGFAPHELLGYAQQHGYSVVSDRSDAELARQHFPNAEQRRFRGDRHIAELEVREGA